MSVESYASSASAASSSGARGRLGSDALGRLTSSAIDLFRARGFDDVTVVEIAKQAGVTSRTFFRYFPTKESVIADGFDVTNNRWVEIIHELPDGVGVREAVEASMVQWLGEHHAIFNVYGPIMASSASLRGAVMSHNINWEKALGDALAYKCPSLDETEARFWAMIALGTVRLARASSDLSLTSITAHAVRLLKSLSVQPVQV